MFLLQITAFLNDYPNALARAKDFDVNLTSSALDVTPQDNDYADILALSVRQMFGNIELTSGWDGTNHVPADIMAFLSGVWFFFMKLSIFPDPPVDGVWCDRTFHSHR